jgi:hypothetical protein
LNTLRLKGPKGAKTTRKKKKEEEEKTKRIAAKAKSF